RYPDLLDGLIVVDTSPLALGMQISTQGRFPAIFAALRGLPLDKLTSRKHADDLLAEHVRSDVVRAFLLQNLRRSGDTWRWQPNLELLTNNLYDIGDWSSPRGATWDGPTLLIAGADSDFVPVEALPVMRQLFPRTQLVTLTGAGHWVHSEQPEAFVKTVRIALETILR
ncbi:MAG: alpha/beta hydrolase, partial [Propionibacteriales bacterium]